MLLKKINIMLKSKLLKKKKPGITNLATNTALTAVEKTCLMLVI